MEKTTRVANSAPPDDYSEFGYLKSLRGVRDLTNGEFRVLVMALTYAKWDTGGEIRPGTANLVDATDLERSTVIRALAALVEKGYLEKVLTGGSVDGRKWASVYRAVVPTGHSTGGVDATGGVEATSGISEPTGGVQSTPPTHSSTTPSDTGESSDDENETTAPDDPAPGPDRDDVLQVLDLLGLDPDGGTESVESMRTRAKTGLAQGRSVEEVADVLRRHPEAPASCDYCKGRGFFLGCPECGVRSLPAERARAAS